MQFKFLTALLLVGACLAQVSLAQSNRDIQQKGIIKDLINQAKEAIEKLTNLMTATISEALKVLNQLKNEVISTAQEAIESAKQLLNNVVSDARKQIQELTDRALELGIDISACIATSDDQFRQLLNDFLKKEVDCVQGEIDRAFDIINESIAIVNEALDAVQALPGKLSECGSGLSSIGCINGVIWETAKLEAQLPLKIAKQVTKATKYVAGLRTRLEICATTQVAGAGIEAAKIVAEVSQCAAEAIEDNIKN